MFLAPDCTVCQSDAHNWERGNHMKVRCPGLKILLPVDESEHAIRSVHFAGRLGVALGNTMEEILILRVISGRYMSTRLPYIDFRAELLKLSGSFAKFRQQHIESSISPSLDEKKRILRDAGIKAPVLTHILDGDPAREIIKVAREEGFNTIIMARRGLSEIMGILLGSVTNKVVHSATGQTVYIVGQQIREEPGCPFPKVLIPVDGSKYSLKGVQHAACLMRDLSIPPSEITLLRVVNLAFYETRLMQGIDPHEEADEILNAAKTLLLKKGVPERILNTKIRVGMPSDEIMKEADEGNCQLILMGRKGRTALKDLILGGVSTTVLQRCQNHTIALVSTK